MPRLRCPRCATVVETAPGAAPVCTSCGFGRGAAPAPAPAARAGPASHPGPRPTPAPAAVPPARPPMPAAQAPQPWAGVPPAGSPKALGGLRTAIVALLALNVPLTAAWALVPISEAGELRPGDVVALAGLWGWAVTMVALAVLVIVFLHRARRNLDARGRTGMKWSPGWTIGAWFVPLGNLVLPILVVGEVAKASRPGPPGDAWRAGPFPGLAAGWGIAWVLYGIAGQAWDNADGTSADGFLGGAFVACGLAAAVLLALVVQRITRDQEAAAGPVRRAGTPATA